MTRIVFLAIGAIAVGVAVVWYTEPADDVAALRRFTGLTQDRFALALGISVHTLRNWEQGRRTPDGPALALLRIVARHPSVLRENLVSSA